MKRSLILNEHPIEIDSSMGWLYIYQRQFGHDVLPDIMPLAEAVIVGMGDIFTAMADNGDGGATISAEKALELMDSDNIVDMFIKMSGMELTTLLNIFWAMAKNGDPATPAPEKFVNSFDRLPLFDELAPALFYIVIDSSASSKNASSLLARIEKAMPSILTLLPSQQSTEG